MKRAPSQYMQANLLYIEIKRIDDISIYADESMKHFEVVRIRRLRKRKTYPNGKTLEAGHEMLPRSEEWGEDGFTYNDLESAEAKFHQLLKEDRISHAEAA